MKLNQFKNTEPKFYLEEYFAGKCTAWGVLETFGGSITKQFVVEISGKLDGKELILEEEFKYKDGGVDHRKWHIIKKGEDRYDGSAEGVIGKASGSVCGQAFHWCYKFRLKVGNRHITVKFNDWMFLQTNNVLINRATISKFGIVVGRLWVFYKKH